MAKVGEGDLRWIVHERQDGTNVNNWHWTEKNCLPWVQGKVEQAYKGARLVEAGEMMLEVKEVSHVKGEASINTRKGKIIHIYELDIKLKLKGTVQGDDVEGTFTFPEVSFEQDDDDQEFDLNFTKGSSKSISSIKDSMYSRGGNKKVQSILASVLKDFKTLKGEIKEVKEVVPLTAAAELIGKGVALERVQDSAKSSSSNTDSSKPSSTTTTSQPSNSSTTIASNTSETINSNKDSTGKVKTRTFKEDFKFRGKPMDIYDALTNQGKIEAFTGSSAKISAEVGGYFEIYGGHITGKFLQLMPGEKLVQDWRMASWPLGHFSRVTMTFEENKDGCVLHLTQEGVPDEEMENIKQAWSNNVFERMKRLFGFSFGYNPF
eukprot:TRINITY_DN1279_c0_g1_i1.p1 TRINITY_DN1279_c0_g1~~TRINITY_DN1279_c0_g1_i1.p1  ORF type:complete len:377 (+),score=108.92 TRINITY_DN1279_c0_g1_i1:70-1200(+)